MVKVVNNNVLIEMLFSPDESSRNLAIGILKNMSVSSVFEVYKLAKQEISKGRAMKAGVHDFLFDRTKHLHIQTRI